MARGSVRIPKVRGSGAVAHQGPRVRDAFREMGRWEIESLEVSMRQGHVTSKPVGLREKTSD